MCIPYVYSSITNNKQAGVTIRGLTHLSLQRARCLFSVESDRSIEVDASVVLKTILKVYLSWRV